jgi:hypothetical protein
VRSWGLNYHLNVLEDYGIVALYHTDAKVSHIKHFYRPG